MIFFGNKLAPVHQASCQRLCVRLSSQCARECLSCMKSIVQILPSCFTHPMSQIKTLGAKKKEARTGTIMEQMSPFRSVFPCRCIKMPQSKAEPHQTAALLLNIQSERRHFLTTSHLTVSVPGEYRHYVECQLQQIASICIRENKKLHADKHGTGKIYFRLICMSVAFWN